MILRKRHPHYRGVIEGWLSLQHVGVQLSEIAEALGSEKLCLDFASKGAVDVAWVARTEEVRLMKTWEFFAFLAGLRLFY